MDAPLLDEIRRLARAPLPRVEGYEPARLWPAGGALDHAAREYRALFLERMYQGDQWPFLERHAAESPFEFQRRAGKTTLNLTRIAIDILSLLYRHPPVRRVDAAPRVEAALRAVWQANALDLLLLHVDRAMRLYGTVAVRPIARATGVEYWVYPPQRLRLIENPEDPARPRAAVVHWDEAVGGTLHRVAQAWTATEYLRLADGEVVEQRRHALGRVPFTRFCDRLDFDAAPPAGRGLDIAHQNVVINGKLSDLAHTVKMQGFGVLEVTNPEPDQELRLGPAAAVRFTVRGSDPYGLAFKHPEAPIAELLAEVEAAVRRLFQSQRIPESALSVSLASNTSGVAIHAAGTPLWEDRQERMMLFRRYEQDLAELTLAVIAERDRTLVAHSPLRLHLDFPEPQPVMSVADRIARDRFLLEQHLVAPWELAMRDDPDRYADAAEAERDWRRRRAAAGEPPSQRSAEDRA